jgi:hypothetical protein
MARTAPARIIVASLAAATVLMLQLTLSALAWVNYCPTNGACIWQDRDLAGAEAGTTGNVSTYTGNYPGTGVPINDSASSAYNDSATKDVYFHNEPDYGGAVFCADTRRVYTWVGLFNNDAWSSHNFTSNDAAC